jgi:hypothetical protein
MYSEYKAKLQVNQSYAIGSVLYSAYVYLDFTHHVGTADLVDDGWIGSVATGSDAVRC